MDNTARVCIVSNTSYYVCSTSPCILEQFRLRHEKKSLGARERMRLLRPRPLACGPVGGRSCQSACFGVGDGQFDVATDCWAAGCMFIVQQI